MAGIERKCEVGQTELNILSFLMCLKSIEKELNYFEVLVGRIHRIQVLYKILKERSRALKEFKPRGLGGDFLEARGPLGHTWKCQYEES